MNDDFEINLIDINTNYSFQNTQLPVNFISFGETKPDDLQVYIKKDVYEKIESYASSDTDKELGSILLGDYSDGLGKRYVVVSACIEAKYTDASVSTITFTHETWDYIHSEHSKFYSDKKIVGWQHTHPNYGVFLSNYDMFIQENFFNLPFQVAYVVDPIQGLRGFFQWKNDKVEKLNGFYVYDDIGKPIKFDNTKKNPLNAAQKVSFPKKIFTVLTYLIAIATITAAVFMFSLNTKLTKTIERQQTRISDQEQSLANLSDKLSNLDEQRKDMIIYFKEYTAKEGDNLYTICQKNDVDYSLNVSIIKAINSIDNSDYIQIGQKILLPVKGIKN